MREEELFHAALAKSGAERAAFLDQACAGNSSLRAAVEALLAAHEASGNFLKPNLGVGDPAATRDSALPAGKEAGTGKQGLGSAGVPGAGGAQTATADLRQDAGLGVVIAGRYTLQEKIGEGGMGEVWVAKQTEPVKRKVALKLIKTGMDSRAVLQRFEQERQALALMDHPNIARVLDGGMTPTGQPFFVMELVNGLPLTKFCDELKLPLKERLELFVPICQAVQHAHQKGIVHRDLKPANILVTMIDGKPAPKVIDFGVAKATSGRLTEETMSTGFGAVVGTLEYMSPEQAGFSGEDIDTRADIYSLGVVLYELLTGLRPIDSKRLKQAALNELIRIIREEEPSKPSTRLSTDESLPSLAAVRQVEPRKLTALLRGELDWVVMKCLEKQRERRYETANGLARDIQRYLADEAVEARPPSAGYRMKKFIHRNRVMVAAVSAVAAALVLGIIGFAWQASVANDQRDQADKARAAADEQRDRAVAAEQETAKRAAELKQVSEFQASMLAGIDPSRAGELLTKDVLGRHSAALAKAGLPPPERDASHHAFAAEWQRVNAVDTAVGLIDREILIPAVRAVDEQFAEQPLVMAQLRLVLASLYSSLGKFDAAQPLADQVLATRRQELGEKHPDTLTALLDLGTIFIQQAKHPEAEACFREALALSRAALGDDHEITRRAANGLVTILNYRGKRAEAEPYSRDAFERNRRILGADHPATLNSLNSLAITLDVLGKKEDAAAMFKTIMETDRRTLGNDNPDTLVSIANYACSSDLPLAERQALIQEVLDTRRRVLGEEHFETVWAMYLLAGLLADGDKLSDAEALYREAHAKMRRIRGEDHMNTISLGRGLASVLRRAGKTAEAETILRAELDKCRHRYGQSVPEILLLTEELRSLLDEVGRYADAEPLVREMLETRRKILPAGHPDIDTSLFHLRRLLQAQNKFAEAESVLREVQASVELTFKLRKARLGPDHPDTISSMSAVAHGYTALGRHPEALALCEEVVKLRKAKLGPDHPVTLWSMSYTARSYIALGRYSEAVVQLEASLAGFQKLLADDPANLSHSTDLLWIYLRLGRVYSRQKRPAVALTALDASLAIGQKLFEANPSDTQNRSLLGFGHAYRGAARVRAGQTAEATADLRRVLELWANAPVLDAEGRGELSRALALLAGLGSEAKSGVTQDEAKAFADQSVAALADALRADWTDFAELKEADFDAVREREDFQKLLADLEAKLPTPAHPAPSPPEKQ